MRKITSSNSQALTRRKARLWEETKKEIISGMSNAGVSHAPTADAPTAEWRRNRKRGKPVMMTRREAAECLGCHPDVIERAAREGLLNPFYVSTRLSTYPEHEVLALIGIIPRSRRTTARHKRAMKRPIKPPPGGYRSAAEIARELYAEDDD